MCRYEISQVYVIEIFPFLIPFRYENFKKIMYSIPAGSMYYDFQSCDDNSVNLVMVDVVILGYILTY